MTDGSFGKLTVVEVICLISKGLRIYDLFPPSYAELSVASFF
jgi:hypothetical protein